ncbi:MAG TPA: hypothetical protein VFL13_13085 [Candidatus Baltobacteraceae bacterium]|nr:hypothetical protein [Candidatus Baltobacteraceae bacterium]
MRLQHDRGESHKNEHNVCTTCGGPLDLSETAPSPVCAACSAEGEDADPASSHLVNHDGELRPE